MSMPFDEREIDDIFYAIKDRLENLDRYRFDDSDEDPDIERARLRNICAKLGFPLDAEDE